MCSRKRYKKKTFRLGPSPLYIDRGLFTSEAYFSLKTTACYIIYGIFLTKRQMKNQGTRYDPCWIITNNGEITFTYNEALETYGISEYKFEKAIANLVEVGLLDITKLGGYKQPTLHALSERWKLYGEEDFVIKEVPKRITKSGFQKGNRYGRNFTSVERDQYTKDIKEQKVQKLQAQIERLKQDKLTALLEDNQKQRRSRIPAIIDQEIEDCSYRLRRLQGT